MAAPQIDGTFMARPSRNMEKGRTDMTTSFPLRARTTPSDCQSIGHQVPWVRTTPHPLADRPGNCKTASSSGPTETAELSGAYFSNRVQEMDPFFLRGGRESLGSGKRFLSIGPFRKQATRNFRELCPAISAIRGKSGSATMRVRTSACFRNGGSPFHGEGVQADNDAPPSGCGVR